MGARERPGPDADEQTRTNAKEALEATASTLTDVSSKTRLANGEDVAETIVDESSEYDLTVIGATRKGLLQKFLFGAVPEQVGQNAVGTVIMAKRNLGISSYLRRLVSNE